MTTKSSHVESEWFGSPNRVRLSYALDAEKIEIGLERIGKYLATR